MKCKAYHIFFRNLANEIKIRIVCELKNKESSVGELSENLNIEQSKLSHALSNLKQCNIVVSRQEGKQRVYSLNKKTIVPILKIIDEKHKCKVCANQY